MIYSMTAFARVETETSFGIFSCEMRSINHRFLEISMHLPESLRVFEMPMREKIRQSIKRGKIECSLRYQLKTESGVNSFTFNKQLAKDLCNMAEELSTLLKNPAAIDPTNLLRFPGILETTEKNVSELELEILGLIEKTVKELLKARNREGEELKKLFFQRLDLMLIELQKVRGRIPTVLKDQQQRLLKRFQEAQVDLDPNRLEQELVIFAQRLDISEEIDRASTHINEIRRILDQGEGIGRRLDFLLQELNREANTLGSKSVDSLITHTAVELKVLIEQFREQVQNIE